MNIIEIIGASTIGIIIATEFLAAIGIAITLYKIYGVTRRFNTGPEVHHHHHHYDNSQQDNKDEYDDSENQDHINPEGWYD